MAPVRPPAGMEPWSGTGRVFRGQRRVRFGDVSPGGRLRLDAIARYLQDVSSDDTADAVLENDMAWVVRRLVIEVETSPRFRESLELSTWCSGTGSRWAERRVSLVGDQGGRVEAAVLWVHVDVDSGRPLPLADDFWAVYAPSALGRSVRARLTHPPEVPSEALVVPWAARFADFDLLGHVNNAVYGAMLEEALVDRRGLRPPWRVEIEYRAGMERDAAPVIGVVPTGSGCRWWVSDARDGMVYATASVTAR